MVEAVPCVKRVILLWCDSKFKPLSTRLGNSLRHFNLAEQTADKVIKTVNLSRKQVYNFRQSREQVD